jgi:hypothetical protein
MKSNTTYKRRNKSTPMTITSEVRAAIESFKNRLIEMAEQPDETSAFDANSVHLIMNYLDDYERNLLLAYYSIAECSPTKLSKYIGVPATCICHRINRLKKKLADKNDIPKSNFNRPRISIDY